jgi:hypothetical protein
LQGAWYCGSRSSAAQFPASFFDNLKGRQVEARGWVLDRSRKGAQARAARWLLPLTDPSMLERFRLKIVDILLLIVTLSRMPRGSWPKVVGQGLDTSDRPVLWLPGSLRILGGPSEQ